MKAAALHVFGDVGASVGVIVAGWVILFTGWTSMEPNPLGWDRGADCRGSLAYLLCVKPTDILLEATPKGINLSALVDDMKQVPEVGDVHDLHVWSITSGMYALSAHVQTAKVPLSECAPIRGMTRIHVKKIDQSVMNPHLKPTQVLLKAGEIGWRHT